ncbi:MAG: endonuclease, partial [Polyangiales bacterium]
MWAAWQLWDIAPLRVGHPAAWADPWAQPMEPGQKARLDTPHRSTHSGPAMHFREAKRALRALYAERPRSFYCDCLFHRGRHVDARTCGYQPKRLGERSRRIEWEHLVPAAHFGRTLPCWQGQGCTRRRGRRCCRRASPHFRTMEGDMHNLVPAIGELNEARADFDFG